MFDYTPFHRKVEFTSKDVNDRANEISEVVQDFLKQPDCKSIIVIMSFSSNSGMTVSGTTSLINPQHLTGLINSCRDFEKGLLDYGEKIKEVKP